MFARLTTSTACIALLAGAGLGGTVSAQETDRDEDVILVTSSALGVGADEVAGAVEIVDRRHLEDNLSGSLADTIAHEPGVSTTYFGPAASRPVIRGLGADRVRVLVNGVGLIDASTNSPDHAVASEALEAESVEILRGPAAIAYGGGAIGGVVNVIDGRIPEARVEDGLEGRFYGSMTSVDDGETAAGRVRFNAGQFVVSLEGLMRTAQPYDIPGYAESEAFRLFEEAEEEHHDDDDHDEDHEDEHEDEHPYGSVENSGLDFRSASAGISWVGSNGFIGVAIKQSNALYGIPGGHAHGEEEHDEDHDEDHDDDHDDDHEDHDEEHGHDESVRIDLEQTRFDLRGEWRNLGAHIERVKFSFGTGSYEHVELEGDEIGTLFTNDGWEGRVEARHTPIALWGGSWEGAAGIQAFNRDFAAIGEEAYVPPSETADWGVFFVERWDAESWGLEGGLRFESRDLDTATDSRSFDTASISGSVFVRPARDTFLAFTLSSSERAPTDVELFADGPHVASSTFELGDPDLGVERAVSAELTARTRFADWALEASVFRADYDGFIAAYATGAEDHGFPVYAYSQDDVVLSGFEGRLEGPLGAWGGWDFDGELTGEYVEASLDAGGDLPRLPPLSVTAGVSASRAGHDLHLEAEWADVQDNTAPFELKSQSYVLFNARWSFEPVESRDMRVILEARNLTDAEARLHTSFLKDQVPLPGRNFRAALVLDF
ncbi:TonB-dependent receptor [Maricaulis maris]|uniref:Iron complex outermembrane receptor protein n=1 Tax=Maricaulis maris TaxID=74318 RepID=A0A495DM26_9PROT|nr:TonB-dependent receptor [Maricaulis maris]RKR03968.1 iron complex outermembrane receptor protein [Maricaulis maris]